MDSKRKLQKAYESLLSNDFVGTAKWLESAVRSDPNNASLHYKLSVTFARNHQWRKAARHAQIAVQLEPDHTLYRSCVDYMESRVLIQEAERCYDGTTDSLYVMVLMLRQAVQLDPLAIEGYRLLGEAYAGLEEYFLAVQSLNEAIKLDPADEYAQELLQHYKQQLDELLWM